MKEFKITTIWNDSTYADWYNAKDKKDALAQYEKDFDNWVGSKYRDERTIEIKEIK